MLIRIFSYIKFKEAIYTGLLSYFGTDTVIPCHRRIVLSLTALVDIVFSARSTPSQGPISHLIQTLNYNSYQLKTSSSQLSSSAVFPTFLLLRISKLLNSLNRSIEMGRFGNNGYVVDKTNDIARGRIR